MAVAFFQIQLSVHPQMGGRAELVVPKVLQGLGYQFIVVKEGGEEGIVKVEASADDLEKVGKDQGCKKLTGSQMKKLQNSGYPPPKLKRRYRLQTQAKSETEGISEPFLVDEQGNRVVDTWQTVRCGFYLVDVLVLTEGGTNDG